VVQIIFSGFTQVYYSKSAKVFRKSKDLTQRHEGTKTQRNQVQEIPFALKLCVLCVLCGSHFSQDLCGRKSKLAYVFRKSKDVRQRYEERKACQRRGVLRRDELHASRRGPVWTFG
jgi:hypothetical protein